MELSDHVFRANGFLIVVLQALVLCDVANGVKRNGVGLRAFGNIVRHGKDLVGALIINQKMIIPEVTPRHVPVEILRLGIECESIGEQRPELSSCFRDPVGPESA
jgi:hypothetical protein